MTTCDAKMNVQVLGCITLIKFYPRFAFNPDISAIFLQWECLRDSWDATARYLSYSTSGMTEVLIIMLVEWILVPFFFIFYHHHAYEPDVAIAKVTTVMTPFVNDQDTIDEAFQ